MQMRMMEQILTPSVKDGKKSDLGAEMFWIGGEGLQRLGCGAEENAINGPLVLQGNVGYKRRDVQLPRQRFSPMPHMRHCRTSDERPILLTLVRFSSATLATIHSTAVTITTPVTMTVRRLFPFGSRVRIHA